MDASSTGGPAASRPSAYLAAGCLGVALAAVLAGLWPWSPAPLPSSAPAAVFSAARALAHVRALAAAPRPLGSPHHEAARAYLVEQLRALGLEVKVQQVESRGFRHGNGDPIVLRNVLARRRGTASSGAVALAAHYDSVPAGPGAGDDAAGVAAILEAVRALGARAPLRNDLVVVITDGEELGLLGAREVVFDPWLGGARVVLNLEARGCRGPSMMFETTLPNAWLLGPLAAAAPAPVASSLMAEVYRRMPNGTDLDVFRRAEIPGLNFAFIGGHEAYHTPLDTAANLAPASVQHHGANLLALAERFGHVDLAAAPAAGDAVYFNPIGAWLVVYPARWSVPLAAAVTVALLLTLARLRRGGRVRLRGTALAWSVLLLTLVLATALAWLLAAAALGVAGTPELLGRGRTLHDEAFFAALALAAMAVTVALLAWVDRRVGPHDTAAAVLLTWGALLWIACLALPGGTYLFTWPLLLALPALWAGGASRAGLATCVGALPVLPMLTFHVHGTFQAMMLGRAAFAVPLLVLVLGLLWPLLRLRPSWLVGAGIGGAVAAFAAGTAACLLA